MNEKIKVLVVDDDQIIVKLLCAFLEEDGFFARGALSGAEGLQFLDAESFDVGIFDMRMPGMDGNEAILKAKKIQTELQIIIHTGSIEYRIPPEIRELGVPDEALFYKPIEDLAPLLGYIRKLGAK